MGLSVATRGFVNTQGNERARIPKRSRFLHSSCSLSARTACIALFPVTLPVGILKSSFTLSRNSGRRSFPAATRPSSWSSAPSATNGTSLATGRLRSRITTSSPPLAKERYLLSRFFSSATFTLRIGLRLPHGYSSHEWIGSEVPGPVSRRIDTVRVKRSVDLNQYKRNVVGRGAFAPCGYPVEDCLHHFTERKDRGFPHEFP